MHVKLRIFKNTSTKKQEQVEIELRRGACFFIFLLSFTCIDITASVKGLEGHGVYTGRGACAVRGSSGWLCS